ncbi:MvaI/BcnI family restriction endonuclease [Lacticaseibacillus parahuelsenbergensis]|uniref:MvaI/BcnI family restriction endonuclease n=1 Tax=Lacticaseibacillus parahuelsenbergensis TaxID=3068305 RepID=A0ABY9L061_9LACO|nr:MvaI/BcnI family restriction endonuclease [Lacticaseibacillus sp. NCIMB 15471]WLV77069.1 MvaI/BcnI family restriction endonuclease [Lacticaseibacillus sp. NCIMB 15471]
MLSNIELLQKKLNSINLHKTGFDLGDNKVWYKSHRNGPTGIGKTFEDLLGKEEDNLPLPDFHQIELKAHDKVANNYITLFTKSPNVPRGINTLLRQAYGYFDLEGEQKILHTSVSSKLQFNAKSNRYFQIEDDKTEKALKLRVYTSNKVLIKDDFTAEWSYAVLEKSLKKKLKTLAIIMTSTKHVNDQTFYSYDAIKIVRDLSLSQLLNALSDNKLFIDLRLGVYHKGKNKGKTHDHGTAFRIKYDDLLFYATTKTLR